MSKYTDFPNDESLLRVLKELGDEVIILGVTQDSDSLGYNQVVSVNGGPPQRVDGTPFGGNYEPVGLKYQVILAVKATWVEGE